MSQFEVAPRVGPEPDIQLIATAAGFTQGCVGPQPKEKKGAETPLTNTAASRTRLEPNLQAPPQTDSQPVRANRTIQSLDNGGSFREVPPAAHRKAEGFFHAIDWPWAQFHRLPAYAPELNPVEHVWTTSKWGPLANAPPEDLVDLNRQVDEELARQADEQRLLQAHFRWAQLELR